MSRFLRLILAVFLAAVAACDDPHSTELGDPIYLDLPGGQATGPRLTSRPDGGLVLSWMADATAAHVLRFAPLEDGQLARPRDVASDARMFVNWADRPSVMQIAGDHWLAHWLRYSADKTYSYDVVVSQSFDNGATWSEAVPVHDDGTPTEHGFVSMHREPDGVALLWLDGRDTPEAPMSLRSAVITPAGQVIRKQLVDDSVCDCCPTDVAVSASGPLAVYRDRTAEEIRDIYISRYDRGAWQAGTRLHEDGWKIAGCPVNGPSIVSSGDNVAVAWFSAADDKPSVKVKLSRDGGKSFAAPVEISTGRLSGYVGLAFIDAHNLVTSWVSRSNDGGSILQLRTVSLDGRLGLVRQLATISQSRVVPQLGYQQGHLFLFWTDRAGDIRELRGAKVPVG